MSNNYKKIFRFEKGKNEYDFRIRRKGGLWWLLLLLLIPLLFIRFNKTITITCLDEESHEPIAYTIASLNYTDFSLLKDGVWLSSENANRHALTDSCGKAVFDSLGCSVFGFVFHPLSKSDIRLDSECCSNEPLFLNFHYTFRKTVYIPARREDLRVKLLDDETGDPLPDATLLYEYMEGSKVMRDSVKADAAGVATIPQMRYCGMMSLLQGSCYGYADTSRVHVPCRNLEFESDSTALRLRPIKERFTFFVKNKETREPIPDAVCQVSLTHPGASHSTETREVHTSIDGKGIAVYDDAFVLSTISITARKQHFKDGKLEGGPWTVENFVLQDDDTRTIWLEPNPYQSEFQNVDSLNLKPIPGVINTITVYHADGTKDVFTETSNSNGIFPVSAKENERLTIHSEKKPEYYDKDSEYPVFKDIRDRKIRMVPVMEDLEFKTVKATDNSLLPDCSLTVTGSISGNLTPHNSGTGEFTVRMRIAETLSIKASKKNFKTNDRSVRNATYDYLRASAANRTIPLELDIPKCNGGTRVPISTGEVHHIRSYYMGVVGGTASIWTDFGTDIPDFLTVYDGIGTSGTVIIARQSLVKIHELPFSFSSDAVTVEIETSDIKSSIWEYEIRCPEKH